MTTPLLTIALILLLVILVLQVVLLFRKPPVDQQANERTERAVREEFSRNRTEAATAVQQTRETMDNALRSVGESLNRCKGSFVDSDDRPSTPCCLRFNVGRLP
jgi:hypothetical protein